MIYPICNRITATAADDIPLIVLTTLFVLQSFTEVELESPLGTYTMMVYVNSVCVFISQIYRVCSRINR